jgi:hypothetical protein
VEWKTPQHGARVWHNRNQSFLSEENHLPDSQDGRRHRSGLCHHVVLPFPDHVPVLLIERQERFARTASRHKDQIAVDQRRGRAFPMNVVPACSAFMSQAQICFPLAASMHFKTIWEEYV